MHGVIVWMRILVCLAACGLIGSLAAINAGAQEDKQPVIDQEGALALGLWDAREHERAAAEAARRYWDYWLRDPNRYWRMHNLWFRTDQLQKWLKDPHHYQPPPPPPPPPSAYPGYFGPYYPYPPFSYWGYPYPPPNYPYNRPLPYTAPPSTHKPK
jgi:hypothetical protein